MKRCFRHQGASALGVGSSYSLARHLRKQVIPSGMLRAFLQRYLSLYKSHCNKITLSTQALCTPPKGNLHWARRHPADFLVAQNAPATWAPWPTSVGRFATNLGISKCLQQCITTPEQTLNPFPCQIVQMHTSDRTRVSFVLLPGAHTTCKMVTTPTSLQDRCRFYLHTWSGHFPPPTVCLCDTSTLDLCW